MKRELCTAVCIFCSHLLLSLSWSVISLCILLLAFSSLSLRIINEGRGKGPRGHQSSLGQSLALRPRSTKWETFNPFRARHYMHYYCTVYGTGGIFGFYKTVPMLVYLWQHTSTPTRTYHSNMKAINQTRTRQEAQALSLQRSKSHCTRIKRAVPRTQHKGQIPQILCTVRSVAQGFPSFSGLNKWFL